MSVQASWENHISAFGANDIDKIMLDYTEASVLRIHDHRDDSTKTFTGLAAIRSFFSEFGAILSDKSELEVSVTQISEETKTVYLVWKCPSSGIVSAHDVFHCDDNFKFIRQNIAITTAFPQVPPAVSPGYNPKTVQEAWDNHFGAFGSQNVDKIMLDYTDSSIIRLYDHSKSKEDLFIGLSQIRELFIGLFAKITDLSTLSAPVVVVEEAPASQVFLIWKCPGCGFLSAHDTFIFDNNFKITSQHIACTTD